MTQFTYWHYIVRILSSVMGWYSSSMCKVCVLDLWDGQLMSEAFLSVPYL